MDGSNLFPGQRHAGRHILFYLFKVLKVFWFIAACLVLLCYILFFFSTVLSEWLQKMSLKWPIFCVEWDINLLFNLIWVLAVEIEDMEAMSLSSESGEDRVSCNE